MIHPASSLASTSCQEKPTASELSEQQHYPMSHWHSKATKTSPSSPLMQDTLNRTTFPTSKSVVANASTFSSSQKQSTSSKAQTHTILDTIRNPRSTKRISWIRISPLHKPRCKKSYNASSAINTPTVATKHNILMVRIFSSTPHTKQLPHRRRSNPPHHHDSPTIPKRQHLLVAKRVKLDRPHRDTNVNRHLQKRRRRNAQSHPSTPKQRLGPNNKILVR